MNSKFTIAVASSLCTLLLMTGVADAKGGGGNGGSSSSRSSASSSSSAPSRSFESKKPEPKVFRSETRAVRSEPKILKYEPRIERKVIKVEPKIMKPETKSEHRIAVAKVAKPEVKIAVNPLTPAAKVALSPQPLPPKLSLGGKIGTTAALAGAGHLAMNKFATFRGAPTAPMADRHKNISSSSMAKFVASNSILHNTKSITPSNGVAKHREAVQHATKLIQDPSKGYKVATYGEKNSKVGIPAPQGGKPVPPKGDNSTIVINENNKTIYVPASNVSGPDRRTIIVNCNNCKVVIVGNTAKNGEAVVDQRNIVVNGSHDKIVLQGDKANGANGTGQAGGSVTDARHVTVNGDKNKIKVEGDSVNGGSGANSATGRGQDGGNGGKVVDTRTVDITQSGEKNKVTMGGDSANGGNAGNGTNAGGNGGKGGDVTDQRDVNDAGHKNKVDESRTDTANGGMGGSGGQPAL
ncbi:MAG: hypothetical protein ABL904_20080 [Hyphomicrobiaceae bacterium]